MSKLLTDIQRRLSSRYTPGEARAVAFALLEDVFGVGLSAAHVETLADDAPIVHDDGTHHRIGRSVECATARQLDAAAHPFLVLYPSVHGIFRNFARGGQDEGAQPFTGVGLPLPPAAIYTI